MHVLPRVRELHGRFPDVLSVIGVHAGKYPAERHTDRIAEACERLEVHHAVVNDRQFRTWREYTVSAWPTVAVIDPEGYLLGTQAGEFSLDALADYIAAIAEKAEAKGSLVRGPDPATRPVARHSEVLRFPTRVAVAADRLWIADTGHRRVLECMWHQDRARAEVLVEYDGFVEPRGIAIQNGLPVVADRGAHSVYRIGYGGERERIAGTEAISETMMEPGPATETALRSPWGVVAHGRDLMIAMAGAHQLWHVRGGSIEPYAGMGPEELGDGPLDRALLAQPTGLAAGSRSFFSAEPESSAVREIAEEGVRTIVGTGLFDFGDRDGVGDDARLQHCEDVDVFGRSLVVADTYNDRLKRVDPVTRECVRWPGEAGEAGALREPGGVCSGPRAASAGVALKAHEPVVEAEPDYVLVADTGNHRVAMVDASGRMTEVVLI